MACCFLRSDSNGCPVRYDPSRLRCMSEQWLQQAEPLVHDLRKAFDDDTERWWQNSLRRCSEDSLRAKDILAESQYITHGQPSPVYDAYATGELCLRFAQEYLWGATESILSKSMFPSFALARSSLEATARGYWLLAPDIGIEERLRRHAQYYAHCLVEVRKTVDTAPQGALAAEVANLKALEEEILAWARFHKLTEKAGTTAFASSCKGFTKIVTELIGTCQREAISLRWCTAGLVGLHTPTRLCCRSSGSVWNHSELSRISCE